MWEQNGLIIGLALFGMGFFLLALSGICFRFRAIANRKPWGGLTLPMFLLGLPVLVVGLGILYVYFPR